MNSMHHLFFDFQMHLAPGNVVDVVGQQMSGQQCC